jgi:hypothetical protein
MRISALAGDGLRLTPHQLRTIRSAFQYASEDGDDDGGLALSISIYQSYLPTVPADIAAHEVLRIVNAGGSAVSGRGALTVN